MLTINASERKMLFCSPKSFAEVAVKSANKKEKDHKKLNLLIEYILLLLNAWQIFWWTNWAKGFFFCELLYHCILSREIVPFVASVGHISYRQISSLVPAIAAQFFSSYSYGSSALPVQLQMHRLTSCHCAFVSPRKTFGWHWSLDDSYNKVSVTVSSPKTWKRVRIFEPWVSSRYFFP